MDETKHPTLFIVASPFQALCMISIVEQFNINNFDVLVQEFDDDKSASMITSLLKEKEIKFKIHKIAHVIKDVLKVAKKINYRYDNIYIGNYYDGSLLAFAVIVSARHGKIYFFDDGTQALEIFSEIPRVRYPDIKVKVVMALYRVIAFFKEINANCFYTIYPVKSNNFNIVNYNFNLSKDNRENDKHGVYIIGTNSSVLTILCKSYTDYLYDTISYIRKMYYNETIYYCPHRRDKNNDMIKEVCKKEGVLFYDTKISVEYDFIKDNINPYSVIGFTSNALFTLKSIYPNSEILTVYYQLVDKKSNKETELIRNRMVEFGINILDLNNGVK